MSFDWHTNTWNTWQNGVCFSTKRIFFCLGEYVEHSVAMSTLTAEQQRKIEENRQRALARRAERLAQGTRQQHTVPSSNANAAARLPSGKCVPLTAAEPSNAAYNKQIEKCQPGLTSYSKQVRRLRVVPWNCWSILISCVHKLFQFLLE